MSTVFEIQIDHRPDGMDESFEIRSTKDIRRLLKEEFNYTGPIPRVSGDEVPLPGGGVARLASFTDEDA